MQSMAFSGYVIFGAVIGILIMYSGFLFVVSTLIKIPGGIGIGFRYSVMGGLLTIIFQGCLFAFQGINYFFTFLLFVGLILSCMLVWRGFEIVSLHKINLLRKPLTGLLILFFALVPLLDLASGTIYRLSAIIPLVTWPFVIWLAQVAWPKAYRLARNIMILGILIIMLGNVIRLFELWNTPAFIALTQAGGFARPLVPFIMLNFIGAILASSGMVLVFFKRVLEETNFLASHDELTGLHNRRAVVERGEREFALASRNGTAITVAFIDIDFFKKINDQYGHDQGDLVLVEISRILARFCRGIDMVGRYGGEEFCMIFPGQDVAGANHIGARLVSAVREHQFGGLPPVTISVGMAILRAGELPSSWDALVKLADEQLNQPKHGGRDRFCIDEMTSNAGSLSDQQDLPLAGALY